MKSTRERILQTLLTHPRSTITELADAVGINAISVRHHLISLQAEGLAAAEEERHGVGRPRMVYFLTEKGLERFPTRYLRLTNRLLDQIKATLPSQDVASLFARMATNLADHYASQAQDLPLEERLDLVRDLLAEEGFTVDWEKQGDAYLVNEITCPYYHIGQHHPEVCKVDQALISAITSVPAEQISCVLRGDAHCTYVIHENAAKEQTA